MVRCMEPVAAANVLSISRPLCNTRSFLKHCDGGVHTVILILDNGTTHAPKQLDSWLREQEAACGGQLSFQILWLPPNASWLDQIEIWFSLLQRTHVQPNHFPSTDVLETSLNEYIAYYNHTAKPINWIYTVEKLEQKVGAHL